jgi:hypothetical protein
MRPPYDFLSAEEREWVQRCQALAAVVLLVVLALVASLTFAQPPNDSIIAGADRVGACAISEQQEAP